MDSEQFERLPSSTNAVESGKATHPLPLKAAMMETYKEDMVKTLEIMARTRGLQVCFESQAVSARAHRSEQQNKARNKRLAAEIHDDPEGPPDTKKKFKGIVVTFCYP